MDKQRLRPLVTLVTLLALCAFLAFGAWWGYKQISAPLHPPMPCVNKATKELATSQVVVRVLNGGFTTGLGATVGKNLEKAGFQVASTGNTKDRVKKTTIVATSEKDPQARLTASFFKDSVIRPDPTRIDGIVDVILGSSYGGMNPSAAKKVDVPSGKACIAVNPNPTPSASSKAPKTSAPAPKASSPAPKG